jgi:indolepyruvate ferredoxin oxidoreductase beta subunit
VTKDGRDVQIVICGLGGQGVLFVMRVVAEAAMIEGRDVLASETHGMAQRGGSVDSHIKIGDFAGPLVRVGHADAAMALDPSRIPDAKAFIRSGGLCFANAPGQVEGALACDAAGVARSEGSGSAANLILLGFASKSAPSLFPQPLSILAALERRCRPEALEAGTKAFEKGRGLA